MLQPCTQLALTGLTLMLLEEDRNEKVIYTFVTTCSGYCRALYVGAARLHSHNIVYPERCCWLCNWSPQMRAHFSVSWHLAYLRINFKILRAYGSLDGLAPPFPSDLLLSYVPRSYSGLSIILLVGPKTRIN